MFWVTCQKLLQSERANQLDAVSSWALQHFNDRSLLITRTTELCDTSFSCNLPCWSMCSGFVFSWRSAARGRLDERG